MSLETDITLLETLDEKLAGHLIRHNDWNDLVGVVKNLAVAVKTIVDADLINKVNTLQTQVNTLLTTTIPGLDGRLQEVEDSIAPLLQNYVMTMQSSRQFYALGEICEITVQVTDLKSQFVNPRPWVDFVCSWGKLRAATGFASSQLGDGGNSLSVQVNSDGVAKVLLSAGPQNASAQSEMQMMAIMNNNVEGETYTVAQAMMQAPAPGDDRARKAYKQMHREYERADAAVWRNYADHYTYGGGRGGIIWGGGGEWDYHYATVTAFARPDGNATTPDGARGVASIQISFRDWVSSWGNDYVTDHDDLEVELELDWDRYVDVEIEKPLDDLLHRVEEQVRDRGIWGRQKFYEAGQSAIVKNVTNGDPMRETKVQIGKALAAQAAADISQMQAMGGRQQQGVPVMGAYMNQGTRTETLSKQVAQVGAEATQAKGLSESVAVLEGRMQNTEQLGRTIQGSLQLINENVRGINALDETSLKGGVQKISAEIAAIKARLG